MFGDLFQRKRLAVPPEAAEVGPCTVGAEGKNWIGGGTAVTHLPQQSWVLNQDRPSRPPGHQPGMSWDTARTQVGTAEPGALSSYRTGPHPLPLMPPSSQGTLVTGFLENWSMQGEAPHFSVRQVFFSVPGRIRPALHLSGGHEAEGETPVELCKRSQSRRSYHGRHSVNTMYMRVTFFQVTATAFQRLLSRAWTEGIPKAAVKGLG